MKKFLLFLSLSLFTLTSQSTHIVGGSLTYEHLGGSSYRINLRLYRAADACDVHVALQNTARVDMYFGSTGAFYQSITVNRIELSLVSPYIDSCAANPACTEIEQGIFTAVVNTMPPIPGGYHLYFETCCRNSAVSNLVNPGGSGPGNGGEGFYCKVPDNTLLLTNSSPQWKQPPPVFICQGFDIDFDHGATDIDGDSLVYSFYTPFSDFDYTDPAPWAITFTAGSPNFVFVGWIPPFSATNPLDVSGATSLTLDPDGTIHGIPPDIGRFAAGVQCSEYRDGVLISSIYRDFQFNVVSCPPPILPVIGESSSCDGDYTVTFSNLSSFGPTTTFLWDFDIASPNLLASDTSNNTTPTHTYPSLYQCYDVMLVTQPHTKCADTAYKNICVDLATADYTAVDSVCINSTVNFTDASSGTPGNPVVSWNWDFDDGGTSVLPSPTHFFGTAGTFNVQLAINTQVGCKDTVIKPFFVQGMPVANAGPDLSSCLNNPTVTLNGSIANAAGGLWVNWSGGVFSPPSPTNLVVDYTPSAAEIAGGGPLYLILTTTGNGMCPSAFDSVTITFVTGPTADAGADISVCRDTTNVQLDGSYTVAGGISWSTTGTGSFVPNNSDTDAVYLPSAADTAAGCIFFYLSTTINANCLPVTDTMQMCFYQPPTMSITANDTICTGQPLLLSAVSSTGSGYWTSIGGDGTYSPDSILTSTTTPTYLPGPGDAIAGNVMFIFVTSNNGGCLAQRDTFNVAVIPSPVPAYTFDQVCFGLPTTFVNTSTAVGGISGYSWLNSGVSFSTTTNPVFTFATEGNQTIGLVVTSNNGCVDTLTQNVIVDYLPNPAFANVTPCLQGGTPFDDNSTVTGSTLTNWDWTFGDGGTSTVQNPNHQYPASGTYSVTLVVTSAQGCIDSLTQSITVLPAPIADFTATPEFQSPFELVNFVDGSSSSVVSWAWDFGDGIGSSTTQNPSYSYDGYGVYIVTLSVIDTNGCVDTTRKEVIIFLPPFVPTGFSPNGTGGNDLLFVFGGVFTELEFKVYNNWGELVYETSDAANCAGHTCAGWDGTYKGAPQPIGVFVWTLRATTPDGTLHEKSGDVTLVR